MIKMIRPLVEMSSRISDCPPEWLRFIEPKLIRGSFLPCWIWTGAMDRNGYPVMKHPETGRFVSAQRYAARLFWEFPEEYYVATICQHRQCLCPRHIVPQAEHPRWSPPLGSL